MGSHETEHLRHLLCSLTHRECPRNFSYHLHRHWDCSFPLWPKEMMPGPPTSQRKREQVGFGEARSTQLASHSTCASTSERQTLSSIPQPPKVLAWVPSRKRGLC